MNNKVITELASIIDARIRCIENNNTEWMQKHEDRIHEIEDNFLPHGSGIDSGCKIDLDKSTGEKVIINTSYHHMNDVGMYEGWTEHKVIVSPSLMHGFILRITGSNRHDIKTYLYDLFYESLNTEIRED